MGGGGACGMRVWGGGGVSESALPHLLSLHLILQVGSKGKERENSLRLAPAAPSPPNRSQPATHPPTQPITHPHMQPGTHTCASW